MQTTTQSNYKEKLICRTCLKIVSKDSYKINDFLDPKEEDETRIAQVLRFIVPELYLGLSANPEICSDCKESVRIAYTFRKQCLETENLIGSFLKNARCSAHSIDLYSVLEYSNTKDRVHQNAQKIISDWEDDSSGDNTELTNKQTAEVSEL
ncbi:hypothetical protein JTB14_001372 [Gonioctena quinquepunctata]|nr:hypothetical protein JTB14_001372 [Gonioctena quinquepunctata]